MTVETTNTASPAVRAKAEGIQLAGKMALAIVSGEFKPEQLVFTLPHSRSHILWLTGHIATSLDRMSAAALNVPMVLPENYVTLFGIGSQPVADVAAYPPFADLAADLGRATQAAVERVLTLGDEDLARRLPESLPVARIFPTLGDLFAGAAFHTSYHTGQISILSAAQGRKSGFGV